jgi:hypothetical protein
LKKSHRILIFIAVFAILTLGLIGSIYAQIDNDTDEKYFSRRKFNAYSFGWDFKDELEAESQLPNNDYYYQVFYEQGEITGFSFYYGQLEVMSYTFPQLNNLTTVDKSESNLRRSIYYMNQEGKPVLIEKYKRGEITSIIRYDSQGKRRITETYDKGYISAVSYTNSDDKPALKQVYQELKLISSEIAYYDENGNDKYNIMVYEERGLKYITEYEKDVRAKVQEYKDNVIDKVYYYDDTGLLYKYEIYDPAGNVIYSYNALGEEVTSETESDDGDDEDSEDDDSEGKDDDDDNEHDKDQKSET